MTSLLNRYVGATLMVATLFILPIVSLIVFTLDGSSENLIHLKDTVLSDYLMNTIKLIISVSILTLFFGIIGAYITVFYELRYAKFFAIALALPFTIPTYILGYIYSDIFSFFGIVHSFLISLGFAPQSFFDVLNFNTLSLVLALSLYPYIYLIVKASFLKSSSALLDPAMNLGKKRFQVFFQIILPLSRVAIIGSLSLVIMEVVNEFGAVSYYGVDTLSTAIYSTWFGMNDPKSGVFLSLMAMGIIFVLLTIEKYSQGNRSFKTELISREIKKTKLKGIGKFLAYFFMLIPILFGFIIPFIWILFYSYTYASSVVDEEFLSALSNSFITSSIAAFLIMFVSLFISYSVRIYNTKQNKLILRTAAIGYAIPGIIIGIGVIHLFGSVDHFLIDTFALDGLLLSGTLFAVVFGYMVRFLAVGINMTESSYERISININKASRNLGYGYFKTLLFVELPLLKKTLLFGFLLVFVDVVKDLPLTLVLRPFNYETLATKTYELAGNTMIQQSSIYAFVIIILCFIPIVLSDRK
jgi:iron(III) transport system permease protein